MIRWREILEKKEAENSAFTLTLAQGLSHGEEKYVLSNLFYEHPKKTKAVLYPFFEVEP